MKLADYLDELSWSQVHLAREAQISTSSVARAIRGDIISRRCGFAIVQALSRGKGKKIELAQVKGLHITSLRRRKKAEPEPEAPARKSEKPKAETPKS